MQQSPEKNQNSAKPLSIVKVLPSWITVDKIKTMDLNGVKVKCRKSMFLAGEYFQSRKAMGIDHSPADQGIKTIYTDDHQTLAKLSLPSSVSELADHFVFFPALFDLALRATILGITRDTLGLVAKQSWLLSLEECQIFSQCPQSIWAWIRPSVKVTKKGCPQKVDIDLCDEKGHVVVVLRGLSHHTEANGLSPSPGPVSFEQNSLHSPVKIIIR